MIDLLGRLWDDATTAQPLPDARFVVITGAAALVLVIWAPSYRQVRMGVTVVHEAGHALIAVLVGRRLSGIQLHSDTSGVTVSRGRPDGPGMVAMLAAGYVAPGVLGVVATLLLAGGYPLGLLWLLVVLLVALLIWVRNFYALLVVVVLGVGLGLVSWYAPGTVQSVIAYLVTWLLLLAAPRPLLELLGRGHHGRRGSDPEQLAGITFLPAVVWILLLLVVTLGGLALGVVTLLPQLL